MLSESIVYKLNYKNPITYVAAIESILGKLPAMPLETLEKCPTQYVARFSGAFGDSSSGLGIDADPGMSIRVVNFATCE